MFNYFMHLINRTRIKLKSRCPHDWHKISNYGIEWKKLIIGNSIYNMIFDNKILELWYSSLNLIWDIGSF